MDKLAFLDKMLAKGKIDKDRYDKAVAILKEKEAVREKFKKDRTKLTKSELMDMLDKLI